MVKHHINSTIVSNQIDPLIWGGVLLAILVWFFYVAFTHSGRFRLFLSFGSAGLVGIVCLAFFNLLPLSFLILVSVLVVVFSFVWSVNFFDVGRLTLFKGLILGGVAFAFVIEFFTFVLYVIPVGLNIAPSMSSFAGQLNMTSLSLSNMAYPLLPSIYLLFVFVTISSVLIVVSKSWIVKIVKTNFATWAFFKDFFESHLNYSLDFKFNRFTLILVVVASIVISCLFVGFTVLGSVNPTQMLVSVDAPVYYEMIADMHSIGDLNSALSYAFSNDRALFLLIAYGLSFIIGSINVVQLVAALLLSMFCIVCFLFLRSMVGLREVWVFGVLLVPFSFQGLGLIYAGFFANMLALVLVFGYLLVFLKARKGLSSFGILSLLGLSVLILFSHSWTWFIFVLALIGFLILEWRSTECKSSLRSSFVLVVGSIVVGLISDFARMLFSPTSSSVSVSGTVSSSIGFPNFIYVVNGLGKTAYYTLGGVFANTLFLFLVLLGFVVLLRIKSSVSNFLLAWIFVAFVPILFASANFVFDRSLFLLPSAVLAGLGLAFFTKFLLNIPSKGRWFRLTIILVVVSFVFFMLLNFSMRYIFNMTMG